jgi:endonuclease/exonuclease/phosphatase family metal-dependent hydrolase
VAEEKSGLWALLATACAVTGLVVLAGFVVVPHGDEAQLNPAALHPTDGATYIAGSQSAMPYTELVARPKQARPVTLTKKPKPKVRKAPVVPPTLDFTISSFNVLGSSHTTRGGAHARFAPGRVRMQAASRLVLQHGVDVVGFQEMQADQLDAFMRNTGGAFDVYPGYRLGRLNTENSLAWRRDMWTPVEERTFSIPYFRGRHRLMPMVKLRSNDTGLEAWFLNVHNPATTGRWGNNQRWRDIATRIETGLVNQLRQSDGVPVFFTGDFNERAEVYCRFVTSTDLEAALGGSGDGGCQPPRIRFVDWIFGSADATFSNYFEDTSQVVRRVSDHPMIVTSAHIEGEPTSDAPAQ